MITPTDARKLNEIDARDLASWEAKIDKALTKYDGQKINVDAIGTTNKLRDKLVEMYSAVGWKVSINYGDQRDPGPWLEFIA